MPPDATPPRRKKPRVGISACLLGRHVRYDGRHKKEDSLLEILEPLVDLVPVCPEFELGLGVPREPVRLENEGRKTFMRSVDTRWDLTEAMERFAYERLSDPTLRNLSGFILKKGSPSCGKKDVTVFSKGQPPEKTGRGLFARALIKTHPSLPVADEEELRGARKRNNFLGKVYAFKIKRKPA